VASEQRGWGLGGRRSGASGRGEERRRDETDSGWQQAISGAGARGDGAVFGVTQRSLSLPTPQPQS
jgi:hypothetical protein